MISVWILCKIKNVKTNCQNLALNNSHIKNKNKWTYEMLNSKFCQSNIFTFRNKTLFLIEKLRFILSRTLKQYFNVSNNDESNF